MLAQGHEINLRTLRRFDSSVDDVLASASQVAIYEFVSDSWTKLEIEGALFIVSKKNSSDNDLIIINRLNTKNLSETIEKSWDVVLNQTPYLLYKNNKGDIRCIWFYDENDSKKIYLKLKEITELKPVKNDLEKTLAKLGIKSTVKNESDQFLRKLMGGTSSSTNTALSEVKLVKEVLSSLRTSPSTINNQTQNFSNTSNKTKLSVEEIFNSTGAIAKSVPEPKVTDGFVLTPTFLKKDMKNVIETEKRQSSPPYLCADISEILHRPKATPTRVDTLNNSQINKSNNLTMEQLKQTLIYLLQNDADFLHTIYKTFNQKNSE